MFYAKLAREAIEAWKQPTWEGCYHECVLICPLLCRLTVFSCLFLGFFLARSRTTTRCGVINVGTDELVDGLRENDRRLGAPIEDLPDARAVRTKLLSSLRPSPSSTITQTHAADSDSNAQCIGSFTNYRGYFNPKGGWVEAARAVEVLLLRVREMGGRVIGNQEVTGLAKDENGWTMGVTCRDGKRFDGDRVILTIGSWTASTFPELELDSMCLATG